MRQSFEADPAADLVCEKSHPVRQGDPDSLYPNRWWPPETPALQFAPRPLSLPYGARTFLTLGPFAPFARLSSLLASFILSQFRLGEHMTGPVVLRRRLERTGNGTSR